MLHICGDDFKHIFGEPHVAKDNLELFDYFTREYKTITTKLLAQLSDVFNLAWVLISALFDEEILVTPFTSGFRLLSYKDATGAEKCGSRIYYPPLSSDTSTSIAFLGPVNLVIQPISIVAQYVRSGQHQYFVINASNFMRTMGNRLQW
ncbi:hypothetical protein BDV38DRAFT_282551 [Aspergillus pseudotamarii]|uniref:Uncharacterized protein n=1 Tax=Aspergillus pseudotamarii TaxID=132259 RepID=A0A5N6SVY6_ASPPS|nr:uncharacterized protein BDV38DRAFT_282551 [Aspergillus pseudotamarii]KAE8137941.1 hypothetical protein BDV38DRAFT_282551 [Aspergillus pseudotamarii]